MVGLFLVFVLEMDDWRRGWVGKGKGNGGERGTYISDGRK